MKKIHLDMIRKVEFSNNTSLLLHKNPTEEKLTFYGIYEKAYPSWSGWKIVKAYLKLYPDLKYCSKILSNVSDLNNLVIEFYRDKYFNKLRLNEINNEHKQLEILCFAINVGKISAIKVIQKLLNIKVDGIIGSQTIKALNSIDDVLFDGLFDTMEIEYYESLVRKKDKFRIYLNGWKNRARAI